MGYERGYVPQFHPEDKPRLPFSWKAVVLTVLAVGLVVSPFVIIFWLN